MCASRNPSRCLFNSKRPKLARQLLYSLIMSNRSALTLSRSSLVSKLGLSAVSALAALAVGCGTPSPAASGEAVNLPAGPPEAPQTLAALGIQSAQLSASGAPVYLAGRIPAAVHDGDGAAQAVLRNLAVTYRLAGSDSLRPVTSASSEDGRLYVKLQQTHGGVPVLHRELIVQAERDGSIGALIGELVPAIKVDVNAAALDGDAALQLALSSLVRAGTATVHEKPTLTIFAPDADEGGQPALAYRALVEYLGHERDVFEELVVSASTGAVLRRNSQRFEALSRTIYDYSNKCLNPLTLPGKLLRNEPDAPATDMAANRIYDGVGSTYWYYKNFHGRDSYDDKGAPLKSSAHVTFNAGASCSGANAAWLPSPYLQMVYGDGDGSIILDTSLGLDVSAHELTHAVTSSTSNLTYSKESGALNEGMSDILGGAVTEAWVDSGGSAAGNPASLAPSDNNWLIGEKVAGPTLPGGALRFMSNPTIDMQSRDYYPERYTGTGDNGGVHLNSGIANLAFYLLSQGGPHPRAKTATRVPGIGMDKAARIFYLANTKLFTASTTFQQARFATAQAAQNIYGRCSREWQNVHMAWDAVGVLGTWSPCVSPPGGF